MKGLKSHVLLLAGPIILCHVLQTLFNTIDLIWMGRLGSQALAGISWANNVLMMLVTLIVGISTGTTAIVTRQVGARDYEEAGRTATHALFLGALCAGVLGILGYNHIYKLLLVCGAEPNVAVIGTRYLKIIFLGASLMFMQFMMNAILQGTGDVKTPVIGTIVATVANMLLDPLLIFGWGPVPALAERGAAIATVMAQTMGLAISLWAFWNDDRRVHIRFRGLRFNLNVFFRILKVAIPGSLQLTVRSSVGFVLLVIIGQYGYQAVAAYGIGFKLLNLSMMPGFGLATTAGILAGQYLGAKNKKKAMRSCALAAFYTALIMQIFGLAFMYFPSFFSRWFTQDREVLMFADSYLRITALPYALVGAGMVFSKVLNHVGDAVSNLLITVFSLWFVQIGLVLFYAKYWNMGVVGIWWGIMVASFIQGASLVFWFMQRKWMVQKV